MPTKPQKQLIISAIFNHSEVTNEVKLYIEKLRVKLAFVISIAFVIIFSILAIIHYYDSVKSFAVQSCLLILCACCILIIRSAKNYKLVFILYSVTGVVSPALGLMFMHNTIHFIEIIWMLACISMAYFFIGKKLGLALLLVSLTSILTFIFYSLDEYVTIIAQPTTYQKLMLSAEMILGFGLNIYLFHLYIRVNKFTNLKLREANDMLIDQNIKINHQNDEKTILIKEVYHRVKNNLQIIISLLRIQSDKIENQEVRGYFQESINQIMAISLVHQKLYKSESLSQLQFSEYATELINTIIKTDATKRTIQFSIISKFNKIGIEALVPIGLILNELTLNSLKHAFSEKKEAKIELKTKGSKNKDWIYITYTDNGRWKATEPTKHSFGLTLIESLVEQLDGTFKIKKRTSGTTFIFRLKNKINKEVIT